MSNLNTIQQDIVELTPEAQQIIFNLIDLLKTNPKPNQQSNPVIPNQDKSDFIPSHTQVHPQPTPQLKSTYQKFVESGLIGCVEVEEDLSTTYKQVLAEGWAKKYDHR
ncbi:MAG: hypothetical protein WCO45_16230 [Pseudanabaena sp. ELA607]|jgi:hypothetical protein